MNELYWITRLDGISFFVGAVAIILLILSVVGAGIYIANYNIYDSGTEIGKNIFKKSIVPCILAWLISIFIPTTKEAITIIGVGGTIDYIKSNDKAKELPDKCIDALDKFIDSYNE